VVTFDPCGHVCDIGRRPYTTTGWMYPDQPRDQPTTIIWFEAAPTARPLRRANAIMSSEWNAGRWDSLDEVDVGEDPNAPRAYNSRWRVLTALSDHVCGTPQEFEGNGTFDPDAVPPLRRPDGLPACCGWIQAGSGCACGTGTATVTYTPPTPPPGASCALAPELSLDVEYTWTINTGEEQWWKWPLTPGTGPYRLVSDNISPFGGFDASFFGGSNNCGAPSSSNQVTADCMERTVDPLETQLNLVVSSFATARTYTFKIEAGSCPP